MSLFQKSVLNTFKQDESLIALRWAKYQNYLTKVEAIDEQIPFIEKFEELDFDEFVTQYSKAKKLKFADKLEERNFKNEWRAIFENDKTLACGFKTEIVKTDKEIDKMVYELYGLSDDEIKIVEGN
ncbi:MAG: hypothetical protein WC667_02835 [Sulfurimonas sp.]